MRINIPNVNYHSYLSNEAAKFKMVFRTFYPCLSDFATHKVP